MTDIEKLAASLTEAQRRVLISCEQNTRPAPVPSWASVIHEDYRDRRQRVTGNSRAFQSIAAKAMRPLVRREPRPVEIGRVLYLTLTPLGLAVRDYLMERQS